MDFLPDLLSTFASQLQKPTLAFLIGGMLIAALGSKLSIPDAIYRFIVFMLLMAIGLEGGMEIREADLGAIVLPAAFAALTGCLIVLIGAATLANLPGVKREDGIATSGLFGAVSASTLAAGMVLLREEEVLFEAWVPALYPFMDIPALVLAIVLARLHQDKAGGTQGTRLWAVVTDSLRSPALSALLLGLLLGLVTKPDPVVEEFYEPLFSGLLSILMLIMGMEAYARLGELRHVAHWYIAYAAVAPLAHGLIGFALGYVAHVTTGFSPGGVVLLAVIAGSNSDISGPPTLRAGIPKANPSAYIGSSTGIGTPIALAIGIPLYLALAKIVFDI